MTGVITSAAATIIIALLCITLSPAHALGGSAPTLAVIYDSATVCGILAQQQTQQIQCWQPNTNTQQQPFTLSPNTIPFDYIAAGRNTLCGVSSGGAILLCWDSNFTPKRIYNNDTQPVQDLTMGDDQICALTDTKTVKCWRGGDRIAAQYSNGSAQFRSISSGLGFSCGVLMNSNRVVCWGSNSTMASFIQAEFVNLSMSSVSVGGSSACGFSLTGFVICKGSNGSGELQVPSNSAFEYSGLALGANHVCATRRLNGSVICWGAIGDFSSTVGVSFESIVAGLNFSCGLMSSNFSVLCWGLGWPRDSVSRFISLPLPKILPGPCIDSNCSDCGIYPESQSLCSGSGNICKPCGITIPPPPPPPPPFQPPPPPAVSPTPSPSRPSRALRKGLLAFAIVGSVGAFSGLCTIIYCLWTGVCCGKKKIHNSVQPTVTRSNSVPGQPSSPSPVSRSSTIRRQGSRIMRRQRSGTSSKHTERAEEFSFNDLAAATDNFSSANKLGAGSFGIVYRGKLWDGREVAIKRGESETGAKTTKFQEKETAFDSEIAFLSRLHHKHLVSLVGYCEDRDERLLVYEYMKNGALYDHLHDKNNVEKSSSVLNSWKMRIKIALDAARGIEYLHNYAVPPIIHRDIKSSNILLDSNWTARVSDFGLSMMGSESDRGFRPTKAAGTIGYIDPEYYGLNVLTAKSDVYGLGVVLLEMLTGKRAIFRDGGGGGGGGEPTRVVDYAVPAIKEGEMGRVLDPRVGPPEASEAEAVELVGYTALHCLNMEGKDRPSMSDIVANLERALDLCGDNSHGSISSGPMSIASE